MKQSLKEKRNSKDNSLINVGKSSVAFDTLRWADRDSWKGKHVERVMCVLDYGGGGTTEIVSNHGTADIHGTPQRGKENQQPHQPVRYKII